MDTALCAPVVPTKSRLVVAKLGSSATLELAAPVGAVVAAKKTAIVGVVGLAQR